MDGSDVVSDVSDIANIDDPESKILNKLPVVVPLLPIFNANKSPVAVVEVGGDQDRLSNEPVPAAPVKEVAIDDIFTKVPVVSVLAASVFISTIFPLVIDEELTVNAAVAVVNPMPTFPPAGSKIRS